MHWLMYRYGINLSNLIQLILVRGSAPVKDALNGNIPPAIPDLRSLFNLVPADAHFPEVLLEDSLPVLPRSN